MTNDYKLLFLYTIFPDRIGSRIKINEIVLKNKIPSDRLSFLDHEPLPSNLSLNFS